MRLSGKTVINESLPAGNSIGSDFRLSEVESTVRNKGINVIFQKSYLCPCKSKESDHRNTCENCGGVGYIFANPTKTQMIISGIKYNRKFEEYGAQDLGMVSVTANNSTKFSFMDQIVITDATAEHTQVLYPRLTDDDTQLFAYTKYDIESIDYVALFEAADQPLKRLTEPADYSFRDNVLTLDAKYNDLVDPAITVRYIHHPVYHIIDISRESFTSTEGTVSQGKPKLILPVHAIAQRAHLIKEVENFDGDRLLDNSWKSALSCEQEDLSKFLRQLRYMDMQDLFDNLTAAQIVQLSVISGYTFDFEFA